ncbi:MAG: SRPBCC family protein [candidate division KSB1 bacterium]|nr:SRPBCC family protein [candidate division KSB1 bacterium]MDZ7336682.1 SRPBCC family protein [candidate division KSB1 bacterium]MDZ7356993.1 SRPBCC family protein [candidate division KSB1 bacterium]MDZ7376326.1 SRPBCC family protein [candidate division KSB1 bacterium]MDZ7400945.1 SRPBCC family protein [candidate division KSB1 bacterium]
MKIIRVIGLIIVVLAFVVLILSLSAPKSYHVERSIVIQVPKHQVFEHIKYWRNWKAWSPWAEMDSAIVVTIAGIDGQIGSKFQWKGKRAGRGEMIATNIQEDEELAYHLRFVKPWESESNGYLRLTAVDDHATQVTWAFYGKSPFPWNFITLFFSLDYMIGGDFERGLERLKSILESQSKTRPQN